MQRFLVYNYGGEVDEISNLFPSERLARMAAILRAEGHAAIVLDRANFTDLLRYGSTFMANLAGLSFGATNPAYEAGLEAEARDIADQGFDVVFMHLWSGTGFKFSMDLAVRLKRLAPGIRIYGIGQKVDWFVEHILDLDGNGLDGLVTGLGYNAVAALARGDDPAGIPSLIVRPTRGDVGARPTINVDDYPPPIYAPDVYRQIEAKVPVYPITLSNQACPSRCVFCIREASYGRAVRRRSVSGVLAEMASLHRDLGVTHFRVEDSTPPRGAMTELARAVLASPLRGRVWLSGFARADVNRDEDFRLMREAGFLALFFGLESLHDETLKSIRKGFTFDTVRRTLERAHAADIRTVGSFIFPLPRETRESMETTLTRIVELKPILDSVLVVPAGVHPPSEWGRHPDRYGIRLADNYVREALLYPIKYLVPIRLWKPLPFTYDLLGKPAAQVTFADIVQVMEEFVGRVRQQIQIPGVPDYYFLVAHLLGRPAPQAAQEIVTGMMQRNYEGLRGLFAGAPNARG